MLVNKVDIKKVLAKDLMTISPKTIRKNDLAYEAFIIMKDEREARNIAQKRAQLKREAEQRRFRKVTLDQIGKEISKGKVFWSLNISAQGDIHESDFFKSSDVVIADEDIIFARQRHINAITRIRGLLKEALLSMEKQEGLEIVAEPLRESLLIFDEVIGKTTTDDILKNIFSRFCIGK